MQPRITAQKFWWFFAGFVGLWGVAWLIASATGWSGNTWFWLPAKAAVWVLYPLIFWRVSLGEQWRFIGGRSDRWLAGIGWGLAAAALLMAITAAMALVRGQTLHGVTVNLTFIYTVIFTPLFEEIMFRGYVQQLLRALRWRVWPAILMTSLLFVAMHLLGWAFQGKLVANGLSSYPVTIFSFSLIAGYIRHRSESMTGNWLFHIVNNLINSVI